MNDSEKHEPHEWALAVALFDTLSLLIYQRGHLFKDTLARSSATRQLVCDVFTALQKVNGDDGLINVMNREAALVELQLDLEAKAGIKKTVEQLRKASDLTIENFKELVEACEQQKRSKLLIEADRRCDCNTLQCDYCRALVKAAKRSQIVEDTGCTCSMLAPLDENGAPATGLCLWCELKWLEDDCDCACATREECKCGCKCWDNHHPLGVDG